LSPDIKTSKKIKNPTPHETQNSAGRTPKHVVYRLHRAFEEVAALSSFPPLLEKELALEAEEPIAPTQIKQQIQAFEAAIETAVNKAKAFETSEPKSFAALNTQIGTWKLQLTEAKAKDEAFDAKRAAEQELLRQLQGKWGELEELQGALRQAPRREKGKQGTLQLRKGDCCRIG